MQGKKIEVTFRETSPYNIQILHKVKKIEVTKKLLNLLLKIIMIAETKYFKRIEELKKRILYKKF